MRIHSDGIYPNVVLGHSVGEIIVVYVACSMSIEIELDLFIKRGKMMWFLPQMDSVLVAVYCYILEAEVFMNPCLNENEQEMVGIRSVNDPLSIVIWGGTHYIFQKVLKFHNKVVHSFDVSHAFYSPPMHDMEEYFTCLYLNLYLETRNNFTGEYSEW